MYSASARRLGSYGFDYQSKLKMLKVVSTSAMLDAQHEYGKCFGLK